MKNILISIVVPIYKVENELERCVDSLLRQTYPYLEIILVDDGSPDRCPQICDEYQKRDQRIKVIHKENGGISDARNTGLLAATGEYVLYIDSDDYIDEETCSQFINTIEEGVDIIAGAYKKIENGKCKIFRHHNLNENHVYSAREFVINSIKRNEWYTHPGLNLCNREFLLNNKLLYKKGLVFEDTEMLPRLFLAAKKVKYIDFPFYSYVIRPNSIMTSKFTEECIQMSIDIYRGWLELFAKISDCEYQRYLYGILVRHYLKNCRRMKISKWEIPGLDFQFAFKYALNLKEKLKVLMFHLLPKIYIKL